MSQAQSFFRKNDQTPEQKREILVKLENTTKLQAKKILDQDSNVRYSFEANEKFESVVERLKGLHPHLTFDELMEKICTIALEVCDPAEKAKKLASKGSKNRAGKKSRVKSRYIPAEVKRSVWMKSEGKCQRCSSAFALEFDHIVPFSRGGGSNPENLRLLCRSCNQRHGIETLGLSNMEGARRLNASWR